MSDRELKADAFRTVVFAISLLGVIAPRAALPQSPADYPTRPIRLVVPFVAGGFDFIAHVLGQKISPAIGQNMFVDNRAGAGGAIGSEFVAKAPPDGHTILVTSSSHTILPNVSKNLPYDAIKDFAPITLVARSVGSVLVVHPSVPARSVPDFIALAKAYPGKLNYGSSGVGSVMHFAAEAFMLNSGTQLSHVPYKGVGQTMIDLLAGRIEVGVGSARAVVSHVRVGKLRALGITSPARWNELSDVPTMGESGLKGFTYATWYGMWFPGATPVDYVNRIRAEVVKAFADSQTSRKFIEEGLVPVASSPQEFAKTIFEEIDLHRQLVARMKLSPQ